MEPRRQAKKRVCAEEIGLLVSSAKELKISDSNESFVEDTSKNIRKAMEKNTLAVKFQREIDMLKELTIAQDDKSGGSVASPQAQCFDPNKVRASSCQKCGKMIRALTEKSHECKIERKKNCEVCGKTFLSMYNLHTHHNLVHNNAKRSGNLNQHAQEHEAKYSCDFCKRSFMTKFCLVKHEKRAHSFNLVSRQKCPECGNDFNNKADMEYHRAEAHAPTKPAVWQIVKFHCHVCGQTFSDKVALAQHSASDHNELYRCDICKRPFSTEELKVEHFSIAHLKCTICEKTFPKRHLLLQHQEKDHGDSNPIKCTKCPELFATKTQYRTHYLADHANRCELCHEPYPTEWLLESHMEIAHNIFQCNSCGAKFHDRNMKMVHLNIVHTKSPVYLCDQCNQVFATKFHLQTHKLTEHSD